MYLSNLVLLRGNSYLDHLKASVQPDTLNKLRTANFFSQGFFLDATLRQTEEEIKEHHASSSAMGPSSNATQHSSQKLDYRFK